MSQGTPTSSDPRVDLARERTGMASFRTQLALDRTTLAWVRRTLTMASFGFGLVGFFRSLRGQAPSAETIRLHQGAIRFGLALIVLRTGTGGVVSLVNVAKAPTGRAPGADQVAIDDYTGAPADHHVHGGSLVPV